MNKTIIPYLVFDDDHYTEYYESQKLADYFEKLHEKIIIDGGEIEIEHDGNIKIIKPKIITAISHLFDDIFLDFKIGLEDEEIDEIKEKFMKVFIPEGLDINKIEIADCYDTEHDYPRKMTCHRYAVKYDGQPAKQFVYQTENGITKPHSKEIVLNEIREIFNRLND